MKKTYSQMTMTEATAAINALKDTLKRGGVHIHDEQVLRLAQCNFAPESNEVKMLLTRSNTVGELLAEVDKLPEPQHNSFDRYTQLQQERQEYISNQFTERKYG